MSAPDPPTPLRRILHVTDELVRRYSRRGNFHSEPDTASALGLPGLVAQGTQATGPAYGLLLEAWGEEFLAHGELDVRFVGLTLAGDTLRADAAIEIRTPQNGAANAYATIEIVNVGPESRRRQHAADEAPKEKVVVVGNAKRNAGDQLP